MNLNSFTRLINSIDTLSPSYRSTNFLTLIHHPEAGTHLYAGILSTLSHTPGRIRMAPPCLGQHNEEALGELLRLWPEETANLNAQGVTGRAP